jgi:hypothetical protein
VISIILAIFLLNLNSAFPVDEKLENETIESAPESVENVTQNEEINEGKN